MKRWLLIPLGAVAVGLVWLVLDPERRETVTSAIGLTTKTTTPAAAQTKPICTYPVNPKVAAPLDCIPAQLANLPPDPGPAGKLTFEGIDSDKDGMRDDVQRWIAENWGHSEVAVKALTKYAQVKQIEVQYGDSLGKEETRKRFGDETERMIMCYGELKTVAMQEGRAAKELTNVVLNTPERWKRSREFDYMFAGTLSYRPNITPTEACGFDPAALAAKNGEQTVAAMYAAEHANDKEEEEPK